ncbi:hypothetical protein DX130_19825 [Paenibacillus paeoniae]|uniref:SLH domain-containing protein n=1 Tax=Paenibacillus paeoniae TaxID=2292705 RepID=A0A371P7M8_9BACL|nr:hypothetical protein DX130_19825 [Paenibacillus paeoniae]
MLSGLTVTAAPMASAAPPTPVADSSKTYVSMKNADFTVSNPMIGDTITRTSSSPPTGSSLGQLGGQTTAWLQYNYGKSAGSSYNNNQIINELGFQQDKVRLAIQSGNAFGSVFNKERITLTDNRSFSSYFSFKMHGGSQADGIVFVIQTASNEAGAIGGGLGYSGVGKSIGIEYDTYRNVGSDGLDPVNPVRNDPTPIGSSANTRASHVALDLNGDVGHTVHNHGKDIANLDLKRMSLAQTGTEAQADPYKQFHSWIDYNGVTKKYEVYLIRENNSGTFYAPVINADGTIQTTGTDLNAQVDTVELGAFPSLNAQGRLVAPLQSDGTEFEIKPIMADKKDLGSNLLQDDVFVGFTAATGGANQFHDINSWYFNNYSGLIVPGTGAQSVEQAPTTISILGKTPLVVDSKNYDFQKDAAFGNRPKGNTPVTGPTSATGLAATEANTEVQAEVKTADGEKIAGYPVTFSMYYVDSYSTVGIGSGRTEVAAKQVDDADVYLTAEGETVKTRTFDRDGTAVTFREITVLTDANGIARVNLWNLGKYPHITNVKASIGGEYEDKRYGGGNSDTAAVLFANPIAPVIKTAEVGPDRHTVIVNMDSPTDFNDDDRDGFSIKLPTPQGEKDIPLKVIGHGKDKYGIDDPFVLVLEIDPDSPAYPPDLPTDFVIPPNTPPLLYYDKDKGSIQGAGEGGAPLDSFPAPGTPDIPVNNRFAPESIEVLNNIERNTVEVKFPSDVTASANALEAFALTINDGINPPVKLDLNSSNAALVAGQSADKIQLVLADGTLPANWNGQIPLNAVISLSYQAEKLDEADRIKDSSDELGSFVNDPVTNQMKPIQAVVINDTTRDKVRVVFAQPLDAASVLNSVNAFTFTLEVDGQFETVTATSSVLDSTDSSGKTIVFTLGEGLPTDGIPTLPSENAPTNITLHYATGQEDEDDALIDVRESGPNGRSLGYLVDFPVANQMTFEPTAAAVGSNPNQVIIKFPANVDVIGQPGFGVLIGDTVIPAVVVSGSGSDTLTLELTDDKEIPRGATAELVYQPSGGDIVDSGDPLRVLNPLGSQTGESGGFPLSNVFVTIETPLNEWEGSKPVTEVTGTSEPGSTLTVVVKDPNNVPLSGTVVSDPDSGNWVWTPDTAISANGEYTVTATAEGKLNTSATTNSSFTMDSSIPMGGNISIVAGPTRNVGDGETPTKVTVTVTDDNGNPVPGAKVSFDRDDASGTPNAGGRFVDEDGNPVTEVTTGPDGKAIIYYESPDLTGKTENQEIVVTASVFDVPREVSGTTTIKITFDPPKLKGKITETDNSGVTHPVAGKSIIVRGQNGSIVATIETDENGEYEFLIPSKQDYTIEYSKPVSDGKKITYKQRALIDKPLRGDGTDEVTANKTVAGVIGSKDSEGALHLIDFAAIGNGLSQPTFVVYLKKDNEYVNASDPKGALLANPTEADGFQIDENGLFIADGLPQENDTYQLEIRYYYDVKDGSGNVINRPYLIINSKSNGELPTAKVQASGEMNISEELIDPFGSITNSATGKLIDDRSVTVRLWFADTARNAANGITPGPVTLPALPGFPPQNNASPIQIVTEGFYAWMVYADSDYYITAEASGYYPYDSRYDKAPHPESSTYIENGKMAIKVERSIVQFDFVMTPRPGSVGVEPSTPEIPEKPEKPETPESGNGELTVNLQTDRSIHQESSESKITVLYKNMSGADLKEGQIRVTLPEGVKVISADGGTVLAGAIVWNVKDVKADTSGNFQIVLQWPTLGDQEQERQVTLKVEFVNSDETVTGGTELSSTIKLLVYSDRAGNLVRERYILGYPDGTFKSEKLLLRAELAAIIARMIGEYDSEAKSYTDVPANFWAAGYINTVTKYKIFEGSADGKFRPNDPVSRAELATVMTRYLKLETGKPIELHFSDVKAGHWAAPAIESLYRNGMITGYSNGSFKPESGIVRSEAVTLINRMLYRGPLTGAGQTWPDVPTSYWAFGQIEDASVSHESFRKEVDGKTVEVFVRKIEDQVK